MGVHRLEPFSHKQYRNDTMCQCNLHKTAAAILVIQTGSILEQAPDSLKCAYCSKPPWDVCTCTRFCRRYKYERPFPGYRGAGLLWSWCHHCIPSDVVSILSPFFGACRVVTFRNTKPVELVTSKRFLF